MPDRPPTQALTNTPIAVIGAGSWGTALAILLARNGQDTTLWGRDAAQLRRIRELRVNERYLPGHAFPNRLRVQADLDQAVAGVAAICIVVPSHGRSAIASKVRA